MRGPLHLSVGRRLALLVVLGALTSTGLLVLAGAALRTIDRELGYIRRFVIAPVDGLGATMEEAAHLQAALQDIDRGGRPGSLDRARDRLDNIGRFLVRYRIAWEVADNPSEDARRFRAQLKRAGR